VKGCAATKVGSAALKLRRRRIVPENAGRDESVFRSFKGDFLSVDGSRVRNGDILRYGDVQVK
jgi:hypothetical protein